jgi:hypothetical protein
MVTAAYVIPCTDHFPTAGAAEHLKVVREMSVAGVRWLTGDEDWMKRRTSLRPGLIVETPSAPVGAGGAGVGVCMAICPIATSLFGGRGGGNGGGVSIHDGSSHSHRCTLLALAFVPPSVMHLHSIEPRQMRSKLRQVATSSMDILRRVSLSEGDDIHELVRHWCKSRGSVCSEISMRARGTGRQEPQGRVGCFSV